MKIFLDMVGCRLNQAEIESIARQFRAEGHAVVETVQDADTVIVNTCSVTTEAASDSRQKIRKAARSGASKVIATGCWSTLQPEQAQAISEVVEVVPNIRKDRIFETALNLERVSEELSAEGVLPFEMEPIARIPLPGLRQRTRSFIKVQDGCDNSCTFCITTVARGGSISVSEKQVMDDINASLSGGTKEIVLTGVNLGSWGREDGRHLRDLIKTILLQTDVQRLRLSSLEPWDLDEAFFELWQDARMCPHLHLPLQSGSDKTLRRMLRKTSQANFRQLVAGARKVTPNMAITTDIITGFPGETEIEFEETRAFVKELQFAGGHVFSYSARPGTPAARIKEQVPLTIRKERNHILQGILSETGKQYRAGQVGSIEPVLWEASAVRTENGWEIEGLTPNYVRVKAFSHELRWNQIDLVLLTHVTDDGMSGVIQA